MARIVLLQFAATLVVAIIAGLIGGVSSGMSAVMGGLSCAIPNALFAARLYASAKKPGAASPMTFYVGEFIKIISTVTLMAATVYLYPDVNWPAFIAAFILVLKSYFILLFRQKL